MSNTTVNIASHLPAMAHQQPDTPAVYMPRGGEYDRLTYQELEDASNAMAHALREAGIKRGMRTVLMVTPSIDFFALVFALFKVGAVMVCVDPGIGIKNLGKCLAEATPTAFVGIPKAHIARMLFGWAKKSLQINIGVGGIFGKPLKRMAAKYGNAEPILEDTQSDEPAAILFTSGSTGVPKGVIYTHGNFDAQVRALIDAFKIEPGEVDLCTFPLFALYAPAMGMTAIVPQMDFTRPGSVEPNNVIEPIKRFNVTNMFGSPALLNRVGRFGEANSVKLPTLKRVISAGAPVPAQVMRRFTDMLNDGVQVFTPYGATESLPVAVTGSAEILSETADLTDEGNGVCVGKPVESITARVIGISDDPIEAWSESLCVDTGVIGEICVKGPVVTQGYFNRDASTKLAKIADPDEGFRGVWHRMGDLGYLDEQGRIWFCGRKSHRVQTADGDMYTIPCEAVFNTHPKVFRTALVGIGAIGQQKPVLCVELEKDIDANEQQIRQELLDIGSKHDHTKSIQDVLFHPSFPVDIRHNAKIGREALGRWAEGKLR